MELRQYLMTLLAWKWIILLGVSVAAGAAYVLSILTRPVYAASTTLLINQAPSDQSTDYNALLTSERLARTYVEVLTTRPVLEEAVQTLGHDISYTELEKLVTVTSIRDTQLIVIEVEHEDPALAMQLANLIPEIFSRQNAALQARRYAETKASLAQEVEALNQQIQETQQQIDALGRPTEADGQAELSRLQSEMTQLRQSYTNLLQSYEGVRLAEAQATDNILVIEPAETPTVPVRPRVFLNTSLAAVLGLLLTVGLVFVMEYFDDSIRSLEQARELLQAPVLGVIARVSGPPIGAGGPLALNKPRSPEAEAFRSVRTNIQYAGVDQPLKTIVVTSAVPGEGKSTVASNLAVVMAQSGLRVVLVDADLRRANLHRIFGRPNRNGLTDLMIQNAGVWDAAVQETPIRNMALVTAGPTPANPADLLGSRRMQQLLEHLAKASDVVIIDTPPTLVATDALVLAPHADATLVVVDTSATRARTAQQVRSQFEQVGVTIRGVVLNKVKLDRASSNHYYQYYYYKYETDQAQAEAPKRWRWPWQKRPAPEPASAGWNSTPEEPAKVES